MCIKHSRRCECGRKEADLNFYDNILPSDVIKALYCPECSVDMELDPESMLADNGWVIKYDMEIAGMYAARLPLHGEMRITPQVLFDDGYATWLGVYPGDLADSQSERGELIKLSRTAPREYMEKMRTWAVSRMERLKSDGWRKAQGE